MKRQSWISHLVLGQLLFTSASAVLLDKVDPSMAEYSEKKEPHPEMLEALEKQGVNANHFKRLLNAFRDPNKFRELADLKGVDDLIPNNNDDGATIKALSDDEYTYSWGSTSVTSGSCSPKTNSGRDTDDSSSTFPKSSSLRRLSHSKTVTAEIMLGTSGDALDLTCESGTLTDPTTECGTSGKYLYYAGQAICKLATADEYYDCTDDPDFCDDEKPTSQPSWKPSPEPSPVPTTSPPTVLSFAPTISSMPTIAGPTKLPTPLPTALPTPTWGPTPTPTSYPTNPDDSAFCTTVKFTCAVDTKTVTFPDANSDHLNIHTVQARMYALMWYYGDVVQKHMKDGTSQTINWWSDLKVSASPCTLYYNGRNGDTKITDYKYPAGIYPNYVTTADGCGFKHNNDDDGDVTIAGMELGAFIGVVIGAVCGFMILMGLSYYCLKNCCSTSSGAGEMKPGQNPNAGSHMSEQPNPGANGSDWSGQSGFDPNTGHGGSTPDWAEGSKQGM